MRIGVIGCGNIFDKAYAPGAKRYGLELAAIADLDQERAASKAREHGIARVLSVDALIDDPDIDCVLNLTIPAAHFELNKRALIAGKHVYVEKPLCLEVAQADALLSTAHKTGRLLACAPDTVLGGGVQTARKLMDAGAISTPFGGIACMACPGHESWHPSPAFYYQTGGGPAFDMAPYYLSALVTLLGPVQRVCAHASRHRGPREVGSGPLAGTTIPVEIDTHLVGMLEFANNTVVQVIFSFEVWGNTLPNIQIFGTQGSLNVPDPNCFGGRVAVLGPQAEEHDIAKDNAMRGIGLADLRDAIAEGRQPRANIELARHVIAVINALHRGADAGWQSIEQQCQRPVAMP